MTENKLFPFPGVQLVKCSGLRKGERHGSGLILISRVKLSRFVFQAKRREDGLSKKPCVG